MTLPTSESLPKAERLEQISRWLQIHKGLGISMMDHLYNKLDGMYTGFWAAQFKSEASIQNWRETWATHFEANGIEPKHIAGGLIECGKRHGGPPTSKTFIDACKAAIVHPSHRAFPHDRRIEHKISPEKQAENRKRLKEIHEELARKMAMKATRNEKKRSPVEQGEPVRGDQGNAYHGLPERDQGAGSGEGESGQALADVSVHGGKDEADSGNAGLD